MADVITAISSAITSAVTSLTGLVTDNVPTILGLVGVVIALNVGIKLFKKLSRA